MCCDASARVAPRRSREPEAIDTETPARNRNSGALIPAISWPYQYASMVRQAGAVQESIVWASIMITTARPRSQST